MKKLIILAVIVIAVIVGYTAYKSYVTDQTNQPNKTDTTDATDAVALTPEEIADAEATKAAVQSNPAPARYTNDKFGFSFNKPEGYTVGALPGENGGQTLIVQKTDNSNQKTENLGFQIVITPLDEPMTLNPDLIKSDIPGTSVNNPLAINLDSKGKGMMFSSNNENFGGKSYEIWFTDANNLYQITSYGAFSEQLKNIIGTWKFQ